MLQLLCQILSSNDVARVMVVGLLTSAIVGVLKRVWKMPDEAKAQKAVAALITALLTSLLAQLAAAQYNPGAVVWSQYVVDALTAWLASMGTYSTVKRWREIGQNIRLDI